MFDSRRLNGSGLFVFSDPGGAKPLLALVKLFEKQLKNYKIISDRDYSFFQEFRLNVEKPNIDSDFNKFNPDFLFTGTSYTSKLELNYIERAKHENIISYSFVDHYTDILKRFIKDGKIVLPNKILVLDKSAKKIACDEGIQNSQIDILNNPYHQYLKQWKPGSSVDIFFSKNKISKKNIITIGLDPLSNAGGIKKFGSDETIVLKKILMSLKRFELNDTIIIIKSHPNQNINLIQEVIDDFKLDVLLIEKIDTKVLIFLSEIVIGIFSNFLIEAKIMKKNIIRFTQNLKHDPLLKKNIGIVCNNEKELHNALNKFLLKK
jgi:hypothetical protein